MASRRAWLMKEGLASLEGQHLSYRPDMLDVLQRREALRVAAAISREVSLEFASAHEGSCIDGIVRRRLNLASGAFALIENGREFSLVPWQPTLAQALGRQVSGVIRSGEFSWTTRRDLGLEI